MTSLVWYSHKEETGQVSKITPHEARTRKLTYSVPVATGVTQTIRSYADVLGIRDAITRSSSGLKTPHDIAIVMGFVSPGGLALFEGDDVLKLRVPLDKFEEGDRVVAVGRLESSGPVLADIRCIYLYSSSRGVALRETLDPEAVILSTVHTRVEVPLFKIPVMVRSKYCALATCIDPYQCPCDDGGYFIINGNEKVLVAQQKLRPNKIFCWKSNGKYPLMAEVRSCHPTKWRSTSTLRVVTSKSVPPQLSVLIPFVMRGTSALECPLVAVLKILGCDTASQMRRIICIGSLDVNNVLEQSLLHPMITGSKEEILDWMGTEGTKERTTERRRAYLHHIVRNELLPHLGMLVTPKVLSKKATYIGFMCRRVARAHLRVEEADDRDHMENRRLDGSGPLLAILFRQLYRNVLKSLRAQLLKAIESTRNIGAIEDFINFGKLTSNISYHFATGNWSLQKGKMPGVVQGLSNMSHYSRLSHLRRTSTPMNREGKNPEPRQLKASQYGLICPSETPEGSGCGLILNLAYLAHVSIAYKCDEYAPLLFKLGVIPYTGTIIGEVVFLNGDIIGTTSDGIRLINQIRELRRSGEVSFEMSVMRRRYLGVIISLDAGRLLRPLYVRKNIRQIAKVTALATARGTNLFTDLMIAGCIEYLDKQEEESWACVATNRNKLATHHTHVELDPSSLLGDCVARIPFAEFNQAPRNNYQANMGKQAMGIPFLSYQHAYYMPHMHVLAYAQLPLVSTQFDRLPGISELPAGQMPIVAIMCYKGDNQEDSLYFKQEAIDRGMFNSWYYRTYKDTLGGRGNEDEDFRRPPLDAIGRRARANYGTVDPITGLPKKGSRVQTDDALIGKVGNVVEYNHLKSNTGSQMKERARCRSTFMRKCEDGIVDSVVRTKDRDGKAMVIVRVRSYLEPKIGDK